MIAAFVLMSYLVTQEWSWSPVADTDVVAYRLYWHASPSCYVETSYVQVDAAAACNETVCDPDRCCFEPGEPPEGLWFLTITAVDSSGNESVDPRRQATCP